jgi:hypothetical protein
LNKYFSRVWSILFHVFRDYTYMYISLTLARSNHTDYCAFEYITYKFVNPLHSDKWRQQTFCARIYTKTHMHVGHLQIFSYWRRWSFLPTSPNNRISDLSGKLVWFIRLDALPTADKNNKTEMRTLTMSHRIFCTAIFT